MSFGRACRPCRTSKVKCDLVRPTCASCARRRILCQGYTNDVDYLFRNENETARTNSQRARSGGPSAQPIGTASGSDIGSLSDDGQQAIAALCRHDIPWLKESVRFSLPVPMTRPLAERAVDVLFSDWILHPCNHGISPGYLHFLPWSYHSVSSNDALRPAVECLAYANMQGFKLMMENVGNLARVRYGTALERVRSAAAKDTFASDDSSLTAILIIDMFELIYLHREEPLGAHGQVIEHVLKQRGTTQLFSHAGFNLWRIAHHRLQLRQTLLGLQPLPEQVEWVSHLDLSNPILHIARDLVDIQQLCHQARQQLESNPGLGLVEVEAALDLVGEMRQLIELTRTWTEHVEKPWQALFIEVDNIVAEPLFPRALPISLPRRLRLYHDIWIAYEWCYHDIGRLIILEAMIDVLYQLQEHSHGADSDSIADRIISGKTQIADVSIRLMETIPAFLGPNVSRSVGFQYKHQKIGHFFCLSACWTLQRAKYVSQEAKDLAFGVLGWVRRTNRLCDPL